MPFQPKSYFILFIMNDKNDIYYNYLLINITTQRKDGRI